MTGPRRGSRFSDGSSAHHDPSVREDADTSPQDGGRDHGPNEEDVGMNDGTVTAPDGSGRQVKLITADDVVAYLKAHPDFFDKHPDLVAELGLVARAQGPGVIDMQQAI